MPLVTTIIDDKSPLISYDATWLPGTSWGDPLATNYYLGTFTTNNVTDGSVTLSFNGTNVWVYGAKRTNHGGYTVQVDSATYSGLNGDENNLFQQVLFNISALSQGPHTLKLTNTATANLYVDIDMIVWQSEVGNTDDQLVAEVVQDTDSRFNYQEPAWGTTSSSFDFNLFSNGTGHVTETYDASVTFTFTVRLSPFKSVINDLCDAVTLLGTSGPYNGPYSVQLDGGQAATYNATNAYPTNYEVVIYHADNLGSGSHQIVLTNLPAGSGQALSIDYARLWTLSSTTTGSATPSTSSDSGKFASPSQDTLSSGAIAGIVIAVVAAVLSAGAAVFFYRRWKAALSSRGDLYKPNTPQQRPMEFVVAATGFSSSAEAGSNRTVLRNDTPNRAFPGRTQQPGNDHAAQYDGAAPPSSGSRDSRSIVDEVNLTAQSSLVVGEGLGRRPLPDAPGGGLSLSTELPKLAGVRRGHSISRSSIAISDVPPDYSEAIGRAGISHT